VRSAENARAVAIGRVRAPERLDLTGWAARLEVSRWLSGAPEGDGEVRIGWEQLAPPQDRPRFPAGARILVALDPLPQGSLWTRRFPHRRGLAVAARGTATLADPDPVTADLLAAWLALPAEERSGEPGVTALARLAARGHPAVAASALPRLDEVPGLESRLSDAGREALAAALRDEDRPRALRVSLLDLVGRRRLAALRPACAALAAPGAPLEAPAREALARIDGGIPPDTVRELLARDDADVRRVALEHGADAVSDARLRRLVVRDSAAAVRSAAATALLRRRGVAGLDGALPALFDPEGRVRGETARRIADLGPAVVPELRALAKGRRAEDLTGVVAALRWLGPEGVRALRELAAEHPDPQVRKLATLALGRAPDSH